MGKSVHNDVLDAALNYIKNNCDLMTVCSAEPTTAAEAISTYALADVGLDDGDFAVADDTSGRKVTVAEQADVEVDVSDDATHVALVDTTSPGKLLYVTTCTQQALTQGNTVTFPAWKINIEDPT